MREFYAIAQKLDDDIMSDKEIKKSAKLAGKHIPLANKHWASVKKHCPFSIPEQHRNDKQFHTATRRSGNSNFADEQAGY